MSQNYQKCPKTNWRVWLFLAGRGTGKTRSGAEWIRAQIKAGAKRVALVAPTYNDAREVMIEGESGLMYLGLKRERPIFLSSRRRLEWPDGAQGHVFSAEDPERLRGPQFDCAWADEFCAWAYPEATLSNLRLGLRLGADPRLVITTTPKPTKTLLELIEEDGVVITRAKTSQNKAFLAESYMETIMDIYDGTQIGRQELDGEILREDENTLFSHSLFDECRVSAFPTLDKIVVAIDPPATSGERADACGLIVAGRIGFGPSAIGYVLYDGTVQGLTPDKWAERAVGLWQSWDADYLLAEVNQGGDMVKTILRAIEADIAVQTVYASKSKRTRAEPVAALYQKGKVKHFGKFGPLEDELCALSTGDMGSKSPDRADALVWALTDLLLKPRSDPRVRKI